MKRFIRPTLQRGFTLVELLVSIVITLFVIAAAGYVYLNTRDTQRAIESSSISAETGTFAMQLIGRDVMNAGAYPAIMPPVTPAFPTRRQFDNYPPIVGIPARATDWISPGPAYDAPIFGCEGAAFDPIAGTCGTAVAGAPDSLVINYFTSDPADNFAGQRNDCTGADVGDHSSNAKRKLNKGGPPANDTDKGLAPQLPLFGSNRYQLVKSTSVVDGAARNTSSLACAGSGAKDQSVFQPILSGIEDMQLTYGVYDTADTRAPGQYYTATEMKSLTTVTIDGVPLAPWARVVSVRVCLMTKTLTPAKIGDEAGKERTYVNCEGTTKTQAANDPALYRRHDEVFSLRNRMNQTF